MPGRIWTPDAIVIAIRAEALAGHLLNYSSIQDRVPSLLRAAERIFGSWSAAVEAAGFDYSTIRRYRIWSRDRVIARILHWHDQGADLSWCRVATSLDPSLAAAALHGNRFDSWVDALRAAGLDPEKVARYRRWTLALIQQELRLLARHGMPIDQESLMKWAPDLRAAIYRIEGGVALQRQELKRQQEGQAFTDATADMFPALEMELNLDESSTDEEDDYDKKECALT